MYSVNLVTGETTFRTVRPAARQVQLVVMPERQPALHISMQCHEGVWEADLSLPSGWLFYAFEVDGRFDWDHDEGSLRTRQGVRCSLALIASVKSQTPQLALV